VTKLNKILSVHQPHHVVKKTIVSGTIFVLIIRDGEGDGSKNGFF
jgi:hypothetical protein